MSRYLAIAGPERRAMLLRYLQGQSKLQIAEEFKRSTSSVTRVSVMDEWDKRLAQFEEAALRRLVEKRGAELGKQLDEMFSAGVWMKNALLEEASIAWGKGPKVTKDATTGVPSDKRLAEIRATFEMLCRLMERRYALDQGAGPTLGQGQGDGAGAGATIHAENVVVIQGALQHLSTEKLREGLRLLEMAEQEEAEASGDGASGEGGDDQEAGETGENEATGGNTEADEKEEDHA